MSAQCKLFLACFPDAEASVQLDGLVHGMRAQVSGARWSSPQRRHLTLHFLADSDAPDTVAIDRARKVASQWRCSAFTVVLDHLRALGHPRRPALALAASVVPDDLQSSWTELHHALLAAGFEREAGRPFLPHLTLAHAESTPVLPVVPAVRLQANECRLVLSVVGQVDYLEMGRWPLRR